MRALSVAFSAFMLAVMLFSVCVELASAADPVVKGLTVQAPDHLTVGDHARILVKIEADRGTKFGLAPGSLPPALALTKPPVGSDRPLSGGRVETTLTIEVAAFAPGEIVIPPLTLAYQGTSGSGQLMTQPARIQVDSVLPASGDVTPRDLRPQVEVGTAPTNWLTPVAISVAAIVLVVLAFVIWRLRSRRRSMEPASPDRALGPEDRARAELDRAGAGFATDGDYVTYYSAVAVTVRSYLTERFGFPAFALTTRELQERMVRHGMDRWQARLTGGLLSQCDAVIFAHYRPAMERADADLTASYEIVEMSRPAPVEEEALVVS